MADQLPHEATGWAAVLSAGALVLTAIVGAVAYVRRRLVVMLNAWRGGDAGLEAKFATIETDHVRQIKELGDVLGNRIVEHEKHDEERFGLLHRRLDDFHREMARREDVARVETKLDQLLLNSVRDQRS